MVTKYHFILEDMPPIELSDGHQVYIAIFKFLSAFFTVGNTYLDNILLCGEHYMLHSARAKILGSLKSLETIEDFSNQSYVM